ncbi:MAG TPA: hypothetical protein DEH78_15835, partial [Solibacterales bacterium]|nr:hypothetical protein [Bryobacterales bacterium]
GSFEGFSPYENRHLELLDLRLNQNWLVGAAVQYIENTGEFAEGATIRGAFMAMIPRLVWPDKPPNSSGRLVSQYTGIEFAQGTSVGVGQVMEFYINYGRIGIVVGFLLIGLLLAFLDTRAYRALVTGDFTTFVTFFVMALAATSLGNSLAELAGSVAAALVMSPALRLGLKAWNRRTQRLGAVAAPAH